MNNTFVAWLLGAVALSWAMGAYNRLVRLRAKGLLAFSDLELTLGRQIALISAHFPEDPAEVDDAPADWHRLLASAKAVNAALKVARLQPLMAVATRGLKEGFVAMSHDWRQLVNLPPDLAGSFLPPSFQLQWEQLAFEVERARSDFNQTVTNYNEAMNQFPATVLAKIFGFKSAQPI